MSESKLNKQLYTDVNRLRLCNKSDSPVRFLLDKSPFNEDGEQEGAAAASSSQEIIILGRIFPNSEIYKDGAYQIEIKLTSTYPFDPPEVRFVTKIYHPNVGEDGKFCHELLKKTAKWSNKTSLVDVVQAVVEHIDKPDIDYSLSLELGREYTEKPQEFKRKAMEFARINALPRA